MECYKEVGQQPVFGSIAQAKLSRRAPTPRRNRKYSCQLQPETQLAYDCVPNRDQKWAPREKCMENASVPRYFPHVLYQPTHAHRSETQEQCKEVFCSVCYEFISLVFMLILY